MFMDDGWRHPSSPPPMVCDICGDHASNATISSKSRWPVTPVCNWCRDAYGRKVSHGAHRDRIVISTIFALAEKLETEAYCKIHRMPHA